MRIALLAGMLLVCAVVPAPARAERLTPTPTRSPPRIQVTTAALAKGLIAWPDAVPVSAVGERRRDGGQGSGHAMSHVCVASEASGLPPIGRRHFEEWEDTVSDDGNGGTVITRRNVRTWQEVTVPCGAATYTVLRCIYGDCPVDNPTDGPPPAGIEVARLAAEYAPYEVPVPVLSPPLTQPGASVIVGLPFFWAVDPAQWHDIHATGRACVGAACTEATITARPTELYLTPGDEPGDVRTCHRPGAVVRSAAVADAQSDDCSYIFQTRGDFTGAVGIHYEIDYVATDGSAGALPGRDVEIAVALPVTEVQALITG